MAHSQVIFIGGRSGVGKSAAAFALHDVLSNLDIQHAVIEGDTLDLAHPAPWRQRLAERNLAVVWANYREAGYQRLIYTNTVSVLEADALTAAMGGPVEATSVLLRASSLVVASRLGARERGESLDRHLTSSAKMADHLDQATPKRAHRLETDGLSPADVAARILALSDWRQRAAT
ncbi:MAG TPA: ATPase [Candidatus Nesterenkonia stercoripullorum]|uniref:ATPase n=1 Tax=Candidatus Nesterenkonia stercoripullorum TaxID=2838701 RepID=A0A9D1UV64_9MICC|nr:ATPase [Candidatus Nesterenkonia stercoripullorum]